MSLQWVGMTDTGLIGGKMAGNVYKLGERNLPLDPKLLQSNW